ncbi:class I SAM-dependent methyltransferase [Campylobacter sp. IFREMER_LSEM_CL1890]|uniref:class I SAM-dependent methyltransferase n=1 Tax=Campylobacter sp. IFREMER_LSEM_CL1890 TaxID=2911615 RepID=UPI001418E1C0|nr:class I SAM-dependent methyltransferase [Campylobacter sp. IFREMER_LSEM_CL1890]EDP6879631.1 methyltransferase domain-containing protein [Campylobacter lari]MCV3408742.1 class I SAM-dependent methyltransferase [Campylobacter sp. IFREMER_LSEM_CL1890]
MQKAWDINAKFWDVQMGDDSNEFHKKVVRPKVEELLNIQDDDYILDIACGNGNFSAYMCKKYNINVYAFDYSDQMIKLAKQRWKNFLHKIHFQIIDANDELTLQNLAKKHTFSKAVSNMAIMDMENIQPLFKSLYFLLKENGIFVFATQHPCFVTLTKKYLSPHNYLGYAFEKQPVKHHYYHRSLEEIFNTCFKNGFIIDGFFEEPFLDEEFPEIIIVRARKISF